MDLERDDHATGMIRRRSVGLRVLTLTIIREGRWRRYHPNPLSRVERGILALLNVPVDI
jgi:hypothetical protein